MAEDNLPLPSFPFSTLFQQHILDGCLSQEIALVNRIMDELKAARDSSFDAQSKAVNRGK